MTYCLDTPRHELFFATREPIRSTRLQALCQTRSEALGRHGHDEEEEEADLSDDEGNEMGLGMSVTPMLNKGLNRIIKPV